jgi:hypothetical protein
MAQTSGPIDGETFALRHFQKFTRPRAAVILGIGPEAGVKRILHALTPLQDVPATNASGWEGS